MRFKYCPDCGARLSEREIGDEGVVPYCESCEKPWFPLFSTCVIVLITTVSGDEVLLLRQNYISTRYFNLVSGYMKPGETAEETVIREVKEEVGLDVLTVEATGSYWFEKKDMLMLGFIGRVEKAPVKLSSEVDRAEWFPAGEAPGLVHPAGSISHTLAEEFLKRRRD